MDNTIRSRCQVFFRHLAWSAVVCLIVVLLIFIRNSFLTITVVNGCSMYPTIENGELLLIDRAHKTCENGDIIFARIYTEHSGGNVIVKRVIANEGESVLIDYEKNEVSINGEVIFEPYINLEEPDPMQAQTDENEVSYLVPDGCIFVMGDNRNYSTDSRSSEVGFISKENVIGIVLIP